MDPVPLRANVEVQNIEFINEYFNGQLNIDENCNNPSLFVLDNVMEHIQDLRGFMAGVLKNTKKGDYIYVCVPSFDLICEKLQFQEIIHEHVHYFTVNELNNFFEDHGFSAIESFSNQEDGRAYNYHIFIRSDNLKRATDLYNNRKINLPDSINSYCKILVACRRNIESISEPIWGVGASELTPTLAYFMKSDLNFLRGIFDTSNHKMGKYMVNIKPKVLSMADISMAGLNNYYFITAPNLIYPILNNLKKHGLQNFITPTFII